MAPSNALKVTIIGKRGRYEHFLHYDIDKYNLSDHRQLMRQILRYSGQQTLHHVQVFWVESKRKRFSISSYWDLKHYLDGCIAENRRPQIYVRRLGKCKLFWGALQRICAAVWNDLLTN